MAIAAAVVFVVVSFAMGVADNVERGQLVHYRNGFTRRQYPAPALRFSNGPWGQPHNTPIFGNIKQ